MTPRPATTTSPDTERFLDVVAQLWPGADVCTGDADEAANGFLLVPGVGRPRMLVPDSRLLAPDAVRGFGAPSGLRARMRTSFVSQLLAHGSGRLRGAPVTVAAGSRSTSIEAHLGDVLGSKVRVAVRLGPPRANSKPVLQVLDARGRTIAFAKVGNTGLTRQLVQDEAKALDQLAGADLRVVEVPRRLHVGRWNGLELLVQSPLSGHPRQRPRPATVASAMREIALCGDVRIEPLACSSYLSRLQQRLAALPRDEASAILHHTLGALARDRTDQQWWFGSWHGDWTVWNTRADGGRLQVWDWERFSAPVPCGFDAVHLHLQTLLNRPRERAGAADRVLADAPRLLADWKQPAGLARSVATAYLIDIGTRYLADDQATAGNHAGRLQTWLLPALLRENRRISPAHLPTQRPRP